MECDKLNNYQNKKAKGILRYVLPIILVLGLIGVIVYLSLNSVNNIPEEFLNKYIEFKGLTFKVPIEYTHKIEDTYLFFSDKNNTWEAEVGAIISKFEVLESSEKRIIAELENAGFKVGNYHQKLYAGMECIATEVYRDRKGEIVAYVKGDASYVFTVSVKSKNKDYDYKVFEDIVRILGTVKYE